MRRACVLALVLGLAAGPALAGPPTAQALAEAAFVPGAGPLDYDPIGRLLDRQTANYAPGPYRAELGQTAYQLSLVRRWPDALRFGAGKLDVAVSPHAGLGVTNDGEGSAEAGATLRLSRADLAGERLKAMGVRDGAAFGDRGRWYLFAAASGRAVGLNMLHDGSGWDRAGWSTDPTSRLVGDAQLGVGWRKGPMQTSLGFVHREVKGAHMLHGVDPQADSMVAFSFSVRPRK